MQVLNFLFLLKLILIKYFYNFFSYFVLWKLQDLFYYNIFPSFTELLKQMAKAT
jgi:hypothetical protein